jgi:hypothetical protein
MLCIGALISFSVFASADIGTLTVVGVDVLVGVPPVLTLNVDANVIAITDIGTHPFSLNAYVGSTNGPETSVVLNIGNFVAGGTYAVSQPNGANPTLQMGGSGPGTPIVVGTATLLGIGLNVATTGLTVTVPTTAAPGTYTGHVIYSLNLGSGTSPGPVSVAYTYTVPVPATTISTLNIGPNPVVATIGSTGTITLTSPAPTGGWTVNLQSFSSYIVVPASLQVPAGATTATFPITTNQPPATFVGTITASATASAHSATLTVYGNYITGLTLSPTSVLGGVGSTGTVKLYLPGNSGGWKVNLSTQFGSVKVPSSVTVPTGATTASFAITTTATTVSTTCGIFAEDGTSAQDATLTLQGDSLKSMTVNPGTISASQTATGTITLVSPAPAGGWVVKLSDEYPGMVTVPASITIAAGASTGTFTITPGQVNNTSLNCGIYANDGLTGTNGTVTIFGDSLASLTLNPATVVGTDSTTGTVTLTGPAPSEGWVVTLKDEYPGTVGIPSTVTVAAGKTSATFTITTKKIPQASLGCGIYATDNNSGTNANLVLLGDSIADLTINPNTIVGGTSTIGTVSLMSAAPAGGWTVHLSTQYPSSMGVPATVVVAAGQTSATFTLTTKATAAAYTAGVYSSDGISGSNTTVTITP